MFHCTSVTDHYDAKVHRQRRREVGPTHRRLYADAADCYWSPSSEPEARGGSGREACLDSEPMDGTAPRLGVYGMMDLEGIARLEGQVEYMMI